MADHASAGGQTRERSGPSMMPRSPPERASAAHTQPSSGFGVNDSGIVVPGMMLAVLVPWFAHLAFALVPATPPAEVHASLGAPR